MNLWHIVSVNVWGASGISALFHGLFCWLSLGFCTEKMLPGAHQLPWESEAIATTYSVCVFTSLEDDHICRWNIYRWPCRTALLFLKAGRSGVKKWEECSSGGLCFISETMQWDPVPALTNFMIELIFTGKGQDTVLHTIVILEIVLDHISWDTIQMRLMWHHMYIRF